MAESRLTTRLAEGTYRGLWRVLAEWFRVPRDPPSMPSRGEAVTAFRPSEGFLRYLKFWFWIGLTVIDVALIGVWIALTIALPIVGAILAIPVLALAILPDIVAYVAIHLRYDTTWYVMSDRSLRLRRGIWTITEMTVTFENVQNVTVRQGPLQRYYGIADVIVQTAGGGVAAGPHGGGIAVGHLAIVEGVANASEIRDTILSRVRASRGAGLGDESRSPTAPARPHAGVVWSREHVAVLREIRDALRERGDRAAEV